MKKILVTGASGFIGKAVIKELLENGFFVVAVVRNERKISEFIKNYNNIKVIECDMAQYLELTHKIDDREIETVIHLAWEGSSGVKRADYNIQLKNIKATLDCIQAVTKMGCKHFFCTGTISENLIMETTSLAVSQNLIYAVAKHNTFYLADILCRSLGMEFTWLRLANIYGPGNETGNLMSYTIDALLKNERPTYSKALVLQDFMYVGDCAKAITSLIDVKCNSKLYYIGTGEYRQLKEFLIEARDVINPTIELGIGERPDDNTIYLKEWFSIENLRNDTGFRPQTTFKAGIIDTIGGRR